MVRILTVVLFLSGVSVASAREFKLQPLKEAAPAKVSGGNSFTD